MRPERLLGPGLRQDVRSGSSNWSPRGLLTKAEPTVVAPALTGLISCIALVAIAGRTARVSGATPPSSWLGLLDVVRAPVPAAIVGVLEICAVGVLVLSWWCLLKAARRLRPRVVAAVGMLWAAPLTLGPPLLSLDAYSYIAQGRLAALGIDPYSSPPSALRAGPWMLGVDPFWRETLSPYGPLAVLLEEAVALTRSPVMALMLLHVIALGCLGLIAVVIRKIAPNRQQSILLLLTVLNPLVLLQLLGAAHWEALMVALVAAALLAWHRDQPVAAIALASTAAAVKAPAGFALAVLLVLYVITSPRGRRLQCAAKGVFGAAAPWMLLSLLVPNALGFINALGAPLSGLTVYAPTTLLAEGMAYVWGLLVGPAPFATILTVCRSGGVLLAAGVCVVLLSTASRRPAGTTIGLGLLVVAVLGPVIYPWYFAWGLVPLALSTRRYDRFLALLSSVMIFTALPGLQHSGALLLSLGPLWALISAALLMVAVTLALLGRFGHLRESGEEKLPSGTRRGAQWRTWISLPDGWRSRAAILRTTSLETPVRTRRPAPAEGRSKSAPGRSGPGGLPGAVAGLTGAEPTGLAPLVSRAAGKVHPACAHAIGIIHDHSPELVPEPSQWQDAYEGQDEPESIRDAS